MGDSYTDQKTSIVGASTAAEPGPHPDSEMSRSNSDSKAGSLHGDANSGLNTTAPAPAHYVATEAQSPSGENPSPSTASSISQLSFRPYLGSSTSPGSHKSNPSLPSPESSYTAKNSCSRPEPYVSALHGSTSLSGLTTMAVAPTVTIVVLCVVSAVRNGIHNVKDRTTLIGQAAIMLSLTWTTVPSIQFTLFNLWVAATIRGVVTRRPYAKLLELDNGADADRSILLDYFTYFKLTAWSEAVFKFKYRSLGPSMLLQLVFGSAAGPLAASLLTTDTVLFNGPIIVQQQCIFNETLLISCHLLTPPPARRYMVVDYWLRRNLGASDPS